MALQTDPTVFSPEDLADESLFDEEEPLTRPGIATPRVVPPRSGKAPRPHIRVAKDPDAQAIEIATKVVEKVAVAKSLVRIFGAFAREHVNVASNIARAYADQKMAEIVEKDAVNPIAQVERARKIANAVTEAARHAASLATARAAARAQEMIEEAGAMAEAVLAPEDAHDDAC